jgi:uroporphyrinogen-III decarboxylase
MNMNDTSNNTSKALFLEREKRVNDAIACRVPDRVPILMLTGAFHAQYAGISHKEDMYDLEKSVEALFRTTLDFEPDMASPAMPSGAPMEALDYKQVKWAGNQLGDDMGYQFVEKEYMKADEYDAFLFDPTDFYLRTYWPRIFGKFSAFAQMPPLRNIFSNMTVPMGFVPFGMPGGMEALEAMKKAGEAGMRTLGALMGYIQKVAAAGFPMMFGGGCQAPFDTLSDFFRGTTGLMKDMYRQPEKVLAATEKLLPMMIELGISGAKMSQNPRSFIPLHKGQEGFMSPEQYEKFYWPTFRQLLVTLVENGVTPIVLAEGTYTARLEFLRDLPEGKIVFWFESVDMKKAKEVLGGRVCIMGNVPMSLMVGGTPDEVKDYCKKTIDIAGKDGGYIMSTAAVMDDAKPENVRAMVDITREYGVY